MKRVIISGGGTGGHIYPALTIAEEMKKLEDVEILYVGSPDGLEAEIVPKAGIPFQTVEVLSLSRRITLKNIVALYKSSLASLQSVRIIKNFKPDVVIGTGGYVCGPILMMASLMGIPTLIQEQNVIAGITNRILGRFVKAVALGYEEASVYFPHVKECVYTGNPIRSEVMKCTKEEGRQFFQYGNDEFVVLVAGGSRGARSINTAMLEVHAHFKNHPHVRILHVTGTQEFQAVKQALGEVELLEHEGIRYGKASTIYPYLHAMPLALASADIAIFRAGAIGLAELTARGIPSILIPYPYAAEDHQTYNAHNLVNHGAARMIVDKALTGRELITAIEDIYMNPGRVEGMKKAAKQLGRPEAAKQIASMALSLAK